jgi:putative DNA primase/helicase
VRIVPDNDSAGREHARKVAESLRGKARDVRFIELPGLPVGGDVSD